MREDSRRLDNELADMLKMMRSFQLLDIIVGRNHRLILENGYADFDCIQRPPLSSVSFSPECF